MKNLTILDVEAELMRWRMLAICALVVGALLAGMLLGRSCAEAAGIEASSREVAAR